MKIAWLLHQVRKDPWDLSSAVSCTRKMKEMKRKCYLPHVCFLQQFIVNSTFVDVTSHMK